jgi:methionyl-tRNA formyltransferase
MKLIILTNKGSLFGKKVINYLLLQKVRIDGVVVINQPIKYYLKLFNFVKKRVGFWEAAYFSFSRLIQEVRRKKVTFYHDCPFIHHYEEMGVNIIYSEGTNSSETIQKIKLLSPDLVILGQAGIIKEEILKIPKIGILNAHPGILPYYRGIDCFQWAIYNHEFDKIGSTIHWVNEGIDTGNIVAKRRYYVSKNDTSLTILDKIYDEAIVILTETVKDIFRGKIPLGEKQVINEGKQYFKMPRRYDNKVKKIIKEL